MDDATRRAVEGDRQYIAGMMAGYNLGLVEDHETRNRIINARLAEIATAKREAALSAE